MGHNIDFPEDGSHTVAVTIIREPTQGVPSLCHTWAGIVGTYEAHEPSGLVTANQFSKRTTMTQGACPSKWSIACSSTAAPSQ